MRTMRFLASAFFLASVASATLDRNDLNKFHPNSSAVLRQSNSDLAGYATAVVTTYTTICEKDTTFTQNSMVHTATKGETLTVTDFPSIVPRSSPSEYAKTSAGPSMTTGSGTPAPTGATYSISVSSPCFSLCSTSSYGHYSSHPTSSTPSSIYASPDYTLSNTNPMASPTSKISLTSSNANFTSNRAITDIITITSILSTITTVCSADTTFATNGATYTATRGQTITITNCPCKISTPITRISSTSNAPVTTYSGYSSSGQAYVTSSSLGLQSFSNNFTSGYTSFAATSGSSMKPAISTNAQTYTNGSVPANDDSTSFTTMTTVVSTLTTVCSAETTITTNGASYTATKGETITITDCPCTLTTESTIASPQSYSHPYITTPMTTRAPADSAGSISGSNLTNTNGFTPYSSGVTITPKFTPNRNSTSYPFEVSQSSTTITTVVSSLTTVCSSATTLITNGGTYTATAGETITISHCPCTVSSISAHNYTMPSVPVPPAKTSLTATGPDTPVSMPTTVPATSFGSTEAGRSTRSISSLINTVDLSTVAPVSQLSTAPRSIKPRNSTQVVSKLTTVCISATTFTTNGGTYSATPGETITVTNCPCTVISFDTQSTQKTPVDTVGASNAILTTATTAISQGTPEFVRSSTRASVSPSVGAQYGSTVVTSNSAITHPAESSRTVEEASKEGTTKLAHAASVPEGSGSTAPISKEVPSSGYPTAHSIPSSIPLSPFAMTDSSDAPAKSRNEISSTGFQPAHSAQPPTLPAISSTVDSSQPIRPQSSNGLPPTGYQPAHSMYSSDTSVVPSPTTLSTVSSTVMVTFSRSTVFTTNSKTYTASAGGTIGIPITSAEVVSSPVSMTSAVPASSNSNPATSYSSPAVASESPIAQATRSNHTSPEMANHASRLADPIRVILLLISSTLFL